jgi:hypothetical protein
MTHTRHSGGRERDRRRLQSGALAAVLVVALAGCTLFGGNSGGGTTSSSETSLAQLAWCDSPLIEFQDDSKTPQSTLTIWDDVKDQLGFTPYLPGTLPNGSCLVLAGGSIHDPIYGGHFSITYNLPATGPLSFSEAPKRSSLDSKLQCTQTATGASTTPTASATGTPGTQNGAATVCLGVIANTSVTIAARQSQSDLETLFGMLKANVDWVPTSSEKVPTTPSPSASPSATATTGH